MAADATGAETSVDLNAGEATTNVENIRRDNAESRRGTPTRLTAEQSVANEAIAEENLADGHTATVIDLRTAEPVIEIDRLRPTGLAVATKMQLGIKRVVDVVVAAAALLLLAPLLLATVLAVKLTSRGPVFFTQPRVGRDGEVFDFVKFRSMRTTAAYEKPQLKELNEMDGPIFKIRNDPRITKVGKVIRKLSIDELPQLAHVLSGKMSLVGPRPHLPDEVAAYDLRAYRRLTVKPGITCIWQVSGRADLNFDTWIDLDLEYIDTWSLTTDARILFKTIPAVLSGKGAY